ncbi:zinc ribbon domain-containing protein [Tunturiibacter empetritectus]
MFCSHCGNQVDPSSRFCPACGAPLPLPPLPRWATIRPPHNSPARAPTA